MARALTELCREFGLNKPIQRLKRDDFWQFELEIDGERLLLSLYKTGAIVSQGKAATTPLAEVLNARLKVAQQKAVNGRQAHSGMLLLPPRYFPSLYSCLAGLEESESIVTPEKTVWRSFDWTVTTYRTGKVVTAGKAPERASKIVSEIQAEWVRDCTRTNTPQPGEVASDLLREGINCVPTESGWRASFEDRSTITWNGSAFATTGTAAAAWLDDRRQKVVWYAASSGTWLAAIGPNQCLIEAAGIFKASEMIRGAPTLLSAIIACGESQSMISAPLSGASEVAKWLNRVAVGRRLVVPNNDPVIKPALFFGADVTTSGTSTVRIAAALAEYARLQSAGQN